MSEDVENIQHESKNWKKVKTKTSTDTEQLGLCMHCDVNLEMPDILDIYFCAAFAFCFIVLYAAAVHRTCNVV